MNNTVWGISFLWLLALMVVLVAIWCWRARRLSGSGRRVRRFHRRSIIVAATACLVCISGLTGIVLRTIH
ncbi:MAG: hypothetical protein KBC83_01120 [Candidatus Moranbacteria bacterium]|nr:hypothetical protein [Candidatus Moranbacteria bacterium]MBP9801259.1 hypothetical protein [Candidatus Moranbacteria bacterium]